MSLSVFIFFEVCHKLNSVFHVPHSDFLINNNLLIASELYLAQLILLCRKKHRKSYLLCPWIMFQFVGFRFSTPAASSNQYFIRYRVSFLQIIFSSSVLHCTISGQYCCVQMSLMSSLLHPWLMFEFVGFHISEVCHKFKTFFHLTHSDFLISNIVVSGSKLYHEQLISLCGKKQ